jgi:hypothetical protein
MSLEKLLRMQDRMGIKSCFSRTLSLIPIRGYLYRYGNIYTDKEISIIIYHLSNIYLSHIGIILFGTGTTYQMQVEFSSYVNLDKA